MSDSDGICKEKRPWLTIEQNKAERTPKGRRGKRWCGPKNPRKGHAEVQQKDDDPKAEEGWLDLAA